MQLFLVVLLLLAGLCITVLSFLVVGKWLRERRFAQSMCKHGRFISWDELEPHLNAGEGTLVIEQAQKDGVRVWWTPLNVVQQAPTQAPAEQELDYLRFTERHPFVTWCFSRYLSPENGEAFLTDPPYSYPPGFVEQAFFKERFPKLQVVMTVKIA